MTASPIPSLGPTRADVERALVAQRGVRDCVARGHISILDLSAAILALFPVEAGEVGWRPIETAPKDGTDVLLWAPHWKAAATGWTFGGDPWQGCRKDTVTKPPTHWQPLPSPPLAEGEA